MANNISKNSRNESSSSLRAGNKSNGRSMSSAALTQTNDASGSVKRTGSNIDDKAAKRKSVALASFDAAYKANNKK